MKFYIKHCKLIQQKDEIGGYRILIFENCDIPDDYIMCTRLPNWNSNTPSLNESGFLKFREVIAGEDSWFDSQKNQNVKYNYSGLYFDSFVKDKKNIEDNLLC